jgi:formamidopyrimidine-DNA glycosylase
MFGWVKIMEYAELKKMKFVQNMGPEPWDISAKQFYARVQRKNRAIKVVLMDQDVMSGVGNIYANDGLWEAGIKPERKASSLSEEEAAAVLAGVIKVLEEGIKYGGASAADQKYLNLDGLGGKYQEHFRTYDRTGEACRRDDGGDIEKVTLGGRGTYFCPVCQK